MKEKSFDRNLRKNLFSSAERSFHSYGLIGDGVADDTKGLQQIVNDSAKVYLKAGKYLISETIILPKGVQLIGQEGTIIIAGANSKNTLLQHGRFLSIINSDGVLIQNITFQQAATSFAFAEWNNACIFILNSKGTKVDHCVFDFKLPYGITGMEAVWISGTESKQNVISKNVIHTLGIKYAENGADGTLVAYNVINQSYSNALTANGNHSSDEVENCKVIGNVISMAGRMGIEDWGNTTGSIIEANKIDGTGMDSTQKHDGIGISAVGVNVAIKNNSVSHSRLYAIEARGNYGVNIVENVILENPMSTGIILNYTFATPKLNLATANVEGNHMEKCEKGVHIFGDYEGDIVIRKNEFRDITTKSISLESNAVNFKLDLLENQFFYTTKANTDRYSYFSYTKYKPGEAKQIVIASGNSVVYTTSAAGGKGIDFGFVIRTDHTTIDHLRFQGRGNRNSANLPIFAITALGANPERCLFKNNQVNGAEVELNGFTNAIQSDNIFVK